jgi:hypothetical protein
MSNHASVIFTWSSVGEDRKDPSPDHYRTEYRAALEKVVYELGGTRAHIRYIAWGCGWDEINLDSTSCMCCECVCLATVNGLSPEYVYPLIVKHAPFLLTEEQQFQVLYKTEDMKRYDTIDKPSFRMAVVRVKEGLEAMMKLCNGTTEEAIAEANSFGVEFVRWTAD